MPYYYLAHGPMTKAKSRLDVAGTKHDYALEEGLAYRQHCLRSLAWFRAAWSRRTAMLSLPKHFLPRVGGASVLLSWTPREDFQLLLAYVLHGTTFRALPRCRLAPDNAEYS